MKVRTIGTNIINDHRAVFIRVSKKSWFCIYYATPLAEKKLARSFHLIKSKNQNQSYLARTRFPALGVSYMYLLSVLIGSLDCLCALLLVRVITLVLVTIGFTESKIMLD